MNCSLNWNQECSFKAQWREYKLVSDQMTRNSMDNSIIQHHNSPSCDIHKQAFFFLLLRKSTVFFALIICNFITPCPHALPCMLYLNNEEEKKKNEGFLSNEKEERHTLVRALILSSNPHNESSYLSLHHGRIQECKGKKTQDFIAKTYNLHLTQALSTHSLTRLDSARMLSQGGGSSLRSISSTPRIHPSKSKRMKPHRLDVATDAAYRDIIVTI